MLAAPAGCEVGAAGVAARPAAPRRPPLGGRCTGDDGPRGPGGARGAAARLGLCAAAAAPRSARARRRSSPAGRRCRRAAAASGQRRVCYTEVPIAGRSASVWYPGVDVSGQPLEAYELPFSGRKLAASVIGLPFGGGTETARVPAGGAVWRGGGVPLDATRSSAVVLVHGFLCTRLDMANIAEALSAQGSVVVAPELEDSVSNEGGVYPGGFFGQVLIGREDAERKRRAVVQEAVEWLRAQGAAEVALVGHSRGGVTVSQMPGRFCRVNMAGFLPPPVDARENFHPSAAEGPMLVVCGTEDEVCCRGPSSLEQCRATVGRLVPQAETWFPPGVGHFSLLDPRVLLQWRARLGPLGPEPPEAAFSCELVSRVVDFLRQSMGAPPAA